jgi:DNA-binding CsgD family transcriptional regulator
MQTFFQNSDERVNCDGASDLEAHGVLACAIEGFDAQTPNSLLARKIRVHRRGCRIATDRKPMQKGLNLSLRQKQILELLAQGKTMRKISRQLRLSFHTVRTHMKRLYMKLGVENRTSAVVMNGEHLKNHVMPGNRQEESRTKLGRTQQILLSLTHPFRFCPLCGRNLANRINGSIKVENYHAAANHSGKTVVKLKSKKVRTVKEHRFYRNEIAVGKNLTRQ